MKENNKQAGISYLRVFATIAIVFLHMCTTITGNSELFPLTDNERFFFTASHMIWWWTVPVFLMITGALLLAPGKDISYRVCIGKYAKKVFLALVIFGIPLAAVRLFADGVRGLALIWMSAAAILKGESFAHLWYLYALIGIYLVLPVLKAFVEKNSDHELRVFLIVLFVFLIVIPTIKRVTGFNIAFSVPLGWTLFYVVSGYYFMHASGNENKPIALSCVAVVTVLLIVFSKPVFHSDTWVYYDNVLIAVEAISIFCLFKNINKSSSRRLWKIDRLCFAVYLIHPVFIHLTYRVLKITPLGFGNAYLITLVLMGLAFTGLAFLGSWILSQIKPLRMYVL